MKQVLLGLSAAILLAALPVPASAQALDGSGTGDRSVSVDVPMGGPSIAIGDHTSGSLAVDSQSGSVSLGVETAIGMNGSEIVAVGAGIDAKPGAAGSSGPVPEGQQGSASRTVPVADAEDCARPGLTPTNIAGCPEPDLRR